VKQPNAKALFQTCDRLADGGPRQGQPLGRLCEAACFDRFGEDLNTFEPVTHMAALQRSARPIVEPKDPKMGELLPNDDLGSTIQRRPAKDFSRR
jgi:hypothetical protein